MLVFLFVILTPSKTSGAPPKQTFHLNFCVNSDRDPSRPLEAVGFTVSYLLEILVDTFLLRLIAKLLFVKLTRAVRRDLVIHTPPYSRSTAFLWSIGLYNRVLYKELNLESPIFPSF